MYRIKHCITFIIFIVLLGCKPLLVSYNKVPPQIPIKDSTKSVLLIDASNIISPGIAMTKKREKVVSDIAKNYLPTLQQQLEGIISIKTVIPDSISPATLEQLLMHNENTIATLLKKYNANIILLLKSYYAGFSQDRIEKTKNISGGIDKIVYYSVFFELDASIYQGNEWIDKTINVNRPHSNRPVISALLARGPGYEANKTDISEMMKKNVIKFSELFLPSTETIYTKQ
jgi:hypothetical protein